MRTMRKEWLLHCRCGLSLFQFAALGLLGFPGVASGQRNPNADYRHRGRCWIPAEADYTTVGLFAMEAGSGEKTLDLDDDDLLDDILSVKNDGGIALDAKTELSANALRDGSILRPQPAIFRGDCAFAEDGRFGRGLVLKAPGSAVVTPIYQIDPGFRAGAWFRPESLGGTLFALESSFGRPAAYELVTGADGRITLLNYGEKAAESEPLLAAGAWRHVAFVFIAAHFNATGALNGARLEVYADGRLAIRHDQTVWRTLRSPKYPLTGRVIVGNGPYYNAAFRGAVDDLHLQKDGRGVAWYPWNNSLQRPESAVGLAASPPFFRSDEDLLLHSPMDGALEPRKGKVEVASVVGKGPHPYLEGIRAQAVNVGASNVLPRYAFSDPIPAAQGTVEFWFSPFDWDNGKGDVSHKPGVPTEGVPLVRLECRTPDGQTLPFLQLTASEMKNHERRWVELDPGTWYHLLIIWDGSGPRYYINDTEVIMKYPTLFHTWNKPPDGAVFSTLQLGGSAAYASSLLYRGCSTLVDELRVYASPFSPPERANAFRRYLPDATLAALPFAHVDIVMNAPEKWIRTKIHLLSTEAERVATVDAGFADSEGVVIGEVTKVPVEKGYASSSITKAPVAYGTYQGIYTFKDGDGQVVRTMTVAHERPAPPWLGLDTLGRHAGEVLPGWEPITVEANQISLWNRRITMDGRGWPGPVLSGGRVLLDPVEITLTTAAGPVVLTPSADAVTFLSKAADVVVTEGVATGGGFTLTTRMETEFDGFMKVTTRLEGPVGGSIEGLRIDFPLHLASEQFYGFWAGDNWFRRACDYRRLPEGEGSVFRSNKTGRNHGSDKYRLRNGRVSFLPHLALTDDDHGLTFLAENDRNWTQSWEIPAQEIVRAPERTRMRLNLVNATTPVGEGLEYVFAIQATPVKALSPQGRRLARSNHFGLVDGFSGKPVTQKHGIHLDFQIFPENMDWDAAKARMENLWLKGGGNNPEGKKPIMYIDRIWHRPAPDGVEYAGTWGGWGGAWRYLPEFQNYQLWYLNEWLRRGVMRGFYIDDCWTKATLKPADGLAYLRDKDKAFPENYEWGFEFFAFRDFLKRLRWVFHDNGVEPLIWCHVTQTAYLPMLAFADLLLEGEDRFPAWGRKADFIDAWGMDRLRYSSPRKGGLPVMWMNKIGNDKPAPAPMPHWVFRQKRSMTAGLLVHDISDGSGYTGGETRALLPQLDDARFIGYWDAGNPFASGTAGCVLSVYRLADRDILVLVNGGKEETVASFTLKPGSLPEGWTADALIATNLDTQVPPEGEDILTVAKDIKIDDGKVEDMLNDNKDDVLDQFFGELENDLKREDQVAAMSDEERELVWFDHTNLKFEGGLLRARIRRHDYRLFELRRE